MLDIIVNELTIKLTIFFYGVYIFMKKIQLKTKMIIISIMCILYSNSIRLISHFFKIFQMAFKRKHKELFPLIRNMLYSNFNVIENFKDLPSQNSIILCNYPSDAIQYFYQWLIPKDICLISIVFLKNIVPMFYEDSILLDRGGSYEWLKKKIKEKIKKRYIFCYFNDPSYRIDTEEICTVRKGIFFIAKELNIPITQMGASQIKHNFFMFPEKQTITIKIGETKYVENPYQEISDITKFASKLIKNDL